MRELVWHSFGVKFRRPDLESALTTRMRIDPLVRGEVERLVSLRMEHHRARIAGIRRGPG